MDREPRRLTTLAVRLRQAKVDENVTALLAAALADELGAGILREHDAAAGRHLTDLIQTAADRAGTTAVNRLVLEVLELLDQEPDLRDRLNQLHPELGAD